MNEFSMYARAAEWGAAGLEDLGALTHVSRRDFDERQTFGFRAQAPSLEYVSLLIENALLLRTHRGGRVYAGFERLSNMEPVVDRYMRIADISERVYVFGEPDWSPPRHPNMAVIRLRGGVPLSREWFVIADSPSLRVALVAVSDPADARALTREERYFRALKTHDPALVQRLAAAAEGLIDRSLDS
jgi:DICT domain-containing protein